MGGRRAAALAVHRCGRALKLCDPRKGGICARRGALASTSAALAACASSRGAFSTLVAWVAANNRALVPPGLRRRRPPRRRAAVRWRGRAAAGRGVEVGRLPRPLAASAPSVWSAWPLAALSHASS